MNISSPAFSPDKLIPQKYTCDGKSVSPPLAFEGVPHGAASLALVMNDPDAPGGTWDHWVAWNMPPTTAAIQEGHALPGVHGRNSWGKSRYDGPCPPNSEHRYVFTLYALDTMLDLPEGSGTRQLAAAMKGHIVMRAELVGRYARGRD